ncbi:flagellar basal body-associated FliL family protein [Nereida sp. MMG025]|uniref:flagellar basal body-associated FliL family protein n=1 Tax=Nereida sp. MMG025 TaxID=2909981 RepID=UPI001F029BBA|nr:flagellar basal body-associated FliL family protein [Nereida sp. MMG025]MCF6444677.1 flagellar basal body-associated FliL family protein [Nereida sp. MMG025]
MKPLLLPILIALVGIGAGAGAGIMMKPTQDTSAEHCLPTTQTETLAEVPEPDTSLEFIKLNNQFVVPIISDTRVTSLVVMSLTIEAAEGTREELYRREPKLRDALLQVMFDHANIGGFSGNFTTSPKMDALRHKLLQATQAIMGDVVTDVLVTDVARQDG